MVPAGRVHLTLEAYARRLQLPNLAEDALATPEVSRCAASRHLSR
jgi:hypothetical protein